MILPQACQGQSGEDERVAMKAVQEMLIFLTLVDEQIWENYLCHWSLNFWFLGFTYFSETQDAQETCNSYYNLNAYLMVSSNYDIYCTLVWVLSIP